MTKVTFGCFFEAMTILVSSADPDHSRDVVKQGFEFAVAKPQQDAILASHPYFFAHAKAGCGAVATYLPTPMLSVIGYPEQFAASPDVS